MKLGFLYAGQGSQHPGMGADLYEAYPAFRAVFDRAPVEFDLKQVCFQDPDGVLNQTQYTQPCMVAFAAGLTAVLRERGILPELAAGLSLGEYSALHAAGVFDAAAAIRLVAFRGKAMERAAGGRESAMVAVLGLDRAPGSGPPPWARWSSPTTTVPARWSSAATGPQWNRQPSLPRSWGPSGPCLSR